MIIDCNIERPNINDPTKTTLIRINKQYICDSIKERLGYSFVKGVYTEITDEDWNIIHEFIKNEKLSCIISTTSTQHKSYINIG